VLISFYGDWRRGTLEPMALLRISIAVFLLGTASAFAQVGPPEPPSVVVSGEGVVMAVPDQAWVRIGSESRSKVSKEAQARNAEAMTAVQQKMTALGIPKDAMRTLAIDLQMEYDYANGRQTPRGYVARNTIEVRVDDFVKLGDVLDAAVGSGATNLHGLRFDVKRRNALEREALQLAVANAMGRAEALAAGAKRTIDRIIRIEESSVSRGGEMPVMAMRMKAEDASTPVAAGELEIRAQVRVTASIK
jgi:uncharacterized protein YggE